MNSAVDHSSSTKGGLWAYWLRRFIHVSMALLPLLYYRFGGFIADTFHILPWQFVIAVIIFCIILEALRLFFRITVVGQREHERWHISSFAWGLISLGLVLILLPPLFAIPIIWSCALVDPLLGELRRFHVQKKWIISIGLLALFAIWCLGNFLLGTPLYYAFIMAPIILAAEWPNLKWIDDNAMMQLVPLAVVLLINVL